MNIQTLHSNAKTLLLENNIGRGISSVSGERYVKSDENKKTTYLDSTSFYG